MRSCNCVYWPDLRVLRVHTMKNGQILYLNIYYCVVHCSCLWWTRKRCARKFCSTNERHLIKQIWNVFGGDCALCKNVKLRLHYYLRASFIELIIVNWTSDIEFFLYALISRLIMPFLSDRKFMVEGIVCDFFWEYILLHVQFLNFAVDRNRDKHIFRAFTYFTSKAMPKCQFYSFAEKKN